MGSQKVVVWVNGLLVDLAYRFPVLYDFLNSEFRFLSKPARVSESFVEGQKDTLLVRLQVLGSRLRGAHEEQKR